MRSLKSFILAVVLAPSLASRALAVAEVDINLRDSGGAAETGGFIDNAFVPERVFTARLSQFFAETNPGFFSATGDLPGGTTLSWDFLPLRVNSGPNDGFTNTLLYWDGLSTNVEFGPTPTPDYRFQLRQSNGVTFAAGGSDELTPGGVIHTTPPNGFMDEHRPWFLDDGDFVDNNGDFIDDNPPASGVYLLSLQLYLSGLADPDPVFLVWGTEEPSVTPAVAAAAAWVQARVDTLVPEDLEGDFNLDGFVDAADYVHWRNNFGDPYTQADYLVWRDAYTLALSGSGSGAGGGSSVAVVPEPAAGVLLLLSAIAGLVGSRKNLFARAGR